MSKPLIFINATKHELGQFKQFSRKFRSEYDLLVYDTFSLFFNVNPISNKEDLTPEKIRQCSLLILGAPRDKFTRAEVLIIYIIPNFFFTVFVPTSVTHW